MDQKTKEYLEKHKQETDSSWEEDSCCQSGCKGCPMFTNDIDPSIPRELQAQTPSDDPEIYEGEIHE